MAKTPTGVATPKCHAMTGAVAALATWRDQRNAVNEVKKARGLVPPGPQLDLAAIRSRARCPSVWSTLTSTTPLSDEAQ